MRRNPFSQCSPSQPSPKRRRIDLSSVGSSESNGTGVIDDKLAQGSTHPKRSASLFQSYVPFAEAIPLVPDGESHLDDFDLELLAQEDGKSTARPHGLPSAKFIPEEEILGLNIGYRNAPQVRSRFFQQTSDMASMGATKSSPSDLISESPSPLAFITKRRQGSQIARGESAAFVALSHEKRFDRPSFLPTSSHPSLEESPIGHKPQQSSHFENIPLSIRGIVLVAADELPNEYRSLFSFPLFNAVQSKCFPTAYRTNDNLVLSAPTGSGKTVIMELAICRLLDVLKDEHFKVIYQAPTKSLCSERFRDWNSKFQALNLKCAELTGDTDHTQLRSVQNSQIIITTPEKWDSVTRKWKDHMRLMQLVKLFLIDEVHILKESRGATLEAVVSRMKNIGSNVRFVALSATVPNSEDIATWLGKDATNQHIPAHRDHFGEEFRPVKLQKFVYGYQSTVNDFAFDKICGSKLPEIIGMHSCQKPIMIFCCTRNSSVSTAKELSRVWDTTNPPSRSWKGPTRHIEVHNEDLQTMITAGVAFHHAGLCPADRHTVEKGFLDGHINVICCTSTLAVGVNLPCHLVIIKNTVSWQEGGCKEYSDLEMMQMLGRAGRPQFDDSATAVILTRKERANHYEKLVSGTESLESCLHLNLIEHLNAEIGLGNVSSVETAAKWLAGTFLFVRLRRNPTYYKLKEGASQEDEDDLLRQICEKDIALLRDCGLVESGSIRSTQFGEAMARYYVRFDTMKGLLSLEPKASLSRIFEMISKAEEFKEVRLKAGEKSLLKEINRDQGIRYPIKVDIALPAHKVSLLLQSELGAIEFPSGNQFQKHKFSMQQEKNQMFCHVNRLVRCVIDCQIAREDSVSILNALELARSFGAKVWDHSPLQMKQIDQVGVVAVRKLAAAGITSIEELEDAEPHHIEMLLSKNPPFGTKLLARLKDFPKLRVNAKMIGKVTGKEAKTGNVKIQFQFEVASMNEKMPIYYQRRPIFVCCLIETSDGRLIDFRRLSASKLRDCLNIDLVTELTGPGQYIICHAMCDEIAGTARRAEIKPELAKLFPFISKISHNVTPAVALNPSTIFKAPSDQISKIHKGTDIFEGDELDFDDFLAASPRKSTVEKTASNICFQREDINDFDWLSLDESPEPPNQVTKTQTQSKESTKHMDTQETYDEPKRLVNGNWACKHKCNDKTSCKHLCCRVGLEKPPRPPKNKATPTEKTDGLSQSTLTLAVTKKDKVNNSKNSGEERFAKKNPEARRPTEEPLQQKSMESTQNLSKQTAGTKAKDKRGSALFGLISSDYEEDEFSDFTQPNKASSPSFVMPRKVDISREKRTCEINIDSLLYKPQNPLLEKSSHGPIAKDIPTTGVSSAEYASDQSAEGTQTFPKVDPILISSDSPPQKRNESFTNIEILNSSVATVTPLTSLSVNKLSMDKRKSTDQEQMETDHFFKPADDVKSRQPSSETSEKIDFDTFLEDIIYYRTTSSESGPPGWEDIDRMLLEEFKDVVDFH